MRNEFTYDAYLNHGAKDKTVVRPLAERLRQYGPTFQPSAFSLQTLLCAPLNPERRFIPLRLDATPIKGSLAQC
jgi:hypothetical protein